MTSGRGYAVAFLSDVHDSGPRSCATRYASPAYQEILELRTEHAASRALLVEGVPAGYRAAETIAKLVAG